MTEDNKYNEFVKEMEETYPLMFAYPYGGFVIGPGWWPIVKSLCRQIQHHIDWSNGTRERLLQNNPMNVKIPDAVEQVTVDQIKEKFGGLRFYYTGGDNKIDGMVRMAESWAAHSCEECGAPGRPRRGGWIRTLCDEHDAERQKAMMR